MSTYDELIERARKLRDEAVEALKDDPAIKAIADPAEQNKEFVKAVTSYILSDPELNDCYQEYRSVPGYSRMRKNQLSERERVGQFIKVCAQAQAPNRKTRGNGDYARRSRRPENTYKRTCDEFGYIPEDRVVATLTGRTLTEVAIYRVALQKDGYVFSPNGHGYTVENRRAKAMAAIQEQIDALQKQLNAIALGA